MNSYLLYEIHLELIKRNNTKSIDAGLNPDQVIKFSIKKIKDQSGFTKYN